MLPGNTSVTWQHCKATVVLGGWHDPVSRAQGQNIWTMAKFQGPPGPNIYAWVVESNLDFYHCAGTWLSNKTGIGQVRMISFPSEVPNRIVD